MPVTMKLKLREGKKHSVRYDSENRDDPCLRSIYIMKTALPSPFPNSVTITIQEAEE